MLSRRKLQGLVGRPERYRLYFHFAFEPNCERNSPLKDPNCSMLRKHLLGMVYIIFLDMKIKKILFVS